MKLYAVYANTWENGYGVSISLFGVFDSLEKAENATKGRNDYFYSIEEVDINSFIENGICLGSYWE